MNTQPVLMSAEAVKAAWDQYEALSFDERINGKLDHLLPKPQADRRCSECKRTLPPFVIGWNEVEWAAKRGKPIEAFRATGICERCADGDDDKEE